MLADVLARSDVVAAVLGGFAVGLSHLARTVSQLAQRIARLEGREDQERGCK